MFNWNRLTFLESTANLKPLIRKATGRTPSTSIAREVATCLQQGRLFFQAAEASALEIRPLLLFYWNNGVFPRRSSFLRRCSHYQHFRDHTASWTLLYRGRELSTFPSVWGLQGPFKDSTMSSLNLNWLAYHDHETMLKS